MTRRSITGQVGFSSLSLSGKRKKNQTPAPIFGSPVVGTPARGGYVSLGVGSELQKKRRVGGVSHGTIGTDDMVFYFFTDDMTFISRDGHFCTETVSLVFDPFAYRERGSKAAPSASSASSQIFTKDLPSDNVDLCMFAFCYIAGCRIVCNRMIKVSPCS